tara:strand:- start:2273 stop:2641 length:369 start_codon:yes stop_codon:yes gene_type:complete
MSQETQNALLQNVKSWLTIDNEIRALQKEIKERRKMKKQLTTDLMTTMKSNDIDALNVPDGELIYNKTKTKAPLSKKHLLSSLTQYFKGDKRMIDELSKFIMETRAEKEKESIRRKIKKNKN